MICRHCRKDRTHRARGLCFGCYFRPEVRRLYPSRSKFAPKGEPTEEELDRTIAEQMQRLPPWWDHDSELQRLRSEVC